jgi:hypothetical protein
VLWNQGRARFLAALGMTRERIISRPVKLAPHSGTPGRGGSL